MGKRRYLLPVYILLILVMFILPYYSLEGYSVLRNTTSQLGAQNTPNSWIMNITFCLLGIASVIEGWIYLKHYWVQKILLTIFGIGLIFTAIFQHAPIAEHIPYSVLEDDLHSIFASIVGFSFTFFAFSIAFIESRNIKRVQAVLIGLIATGLSILMFSVANYTGIWQRLIFLVSFAWLIYLFEGKRATKGEKISSRN